MGFKKTIVVRHIRGQTFEVEVETDADGLGLKVLIFEQRGIALECQRLVYAGKEINDADILGALGIEDGSTVFLVETNAVLADAVAAPASVSAPAAAEMAVRHSQVQVVSVPRVAMGECEEAQAQPGEYVPMVEGVAQVANLDQILLLNKQVRRFVWFALVLSLTLGWCTLGLFNFLQLLAWGFALRATSQLKHACLIPALIFLWLVVIVIFATTVWLFAQANVGAGFIVLFIDIMFGCIASSVCKLRKMLKALDAAQLEAARTRLRATRKCCCECCW